MASRPQGVPAGGITRLVGASKNIYNITGYFENANLARGCRTTTASAFYSGLDRSTAFSQDDIGTLAASLGYLFTRI